MTKLPAYAIAADDGAIEIDVAAAYPSMLKRLGLKLDQYGLEVARRCVTEEIVELVGKPLHIRFKPADAKAKERYALANNPAGRGAIAGSVEFRSHWNRLQEKQAAADK